MPRFTKKPLTIEAVQWTGDNLDEIQAFDPDHRRILGGGAMPLVIWTLEGPLNAQVGDWIVRGVKGELYPVKPEVFEATYEPAD